MLWILDEHEGLRQLLDSILAEQKEQRALLEEIHHSYRQAKAMSAMKLAAYAVFGLFAAGAVYYYYSTMVGMFG